VYDAIACLLSLMAGKLDVAASFGSVFLEHSTNFDVNACYVSNYGTAERILHLLIDKCEPFNKMMEKIQVDNHGKFSVLSHLMLCYSDGVSALVVLQLFSLVS